MTPQLSFQMLVDMGFTADDATHFLERAAKRERKYVFKGRFTPEEADKIRRDYPDSAFNRPKYYTEADK